MQAEAAEEGMAAKAAEAAEEEIPAEAAEEAEEETAAEEAEKSPSLNFFKIAASLALPKVRPAEGCPYKFFLITMNKGS